MPRLNTPTTQIDRLTDRSLIRLPRTLVRSTTGLIVGLVFVATHAFADPLSNARQIENQTNQTAQVAQKSINANSDTSLQLKNEIESLQEQVKNLSIYQTHLTKLVESQHSEMESMEQQLVQITATKQGLIPLMYDMLDGLETQIHQGIPINMEKREKRLTALNQLMGRADISESEKYRRILEAYQIEIDYGSKLAVYQDKITLSDSDVREVELLHLGKVVFVARSKDRQNAWTWSEQDKKWQPITSSELDNINLAYDVANQNQAPSLITLPLSVSAVSAESNPAEGQ